MPAQIGEDHLPAAREEFGDDVIIAPAMFADAVTPEQRAIHRGIRRAIVPDEKADAVGGSEPAGFDGEFSRRDCVGIHDVTAGTEGCGSVASSASGNGAGSTAVVSSGT